MKTIEVSALEYEALKNIDKMVRVAMANAGAAEVLVAAIQALDAVRRADAGDSAGPIITDAATLPQT